MRLIDVEYALQQLEIGEFEHRGVFETDSCHIKDFLNVLPTVDSVEVAHGQWLPTSYMIPSVMCSECFYPVGKEYEREFKYCPSCGACMDGGK